MTSWPASVPAFANGGKGMNELQVLRACVHGDAEVELVIGEILQFRGWHDRTEPLLGRLRAFATDAEFADDRRRSGVDGRANECE